MAPSATSILSAALGGKPTPSSSDSSSKSKQAASQPVGTPTKVKSLRSELKEVGRRIRESREAQNLTQQELGKILGVSNKTVSALELANVEPSITQLMAISRTFGKPLGYFTGESLPSAHEQLAGIKQQLAELKAKLS